MEQARGADGGDTNVASATRGRPLLQPAHHSESQGLGSVDCGGPATYRSRSTLDQLRTTFASSGAHRRGSHDVGAPLTQDFMVEVESAQELLLATEDTTGNFQITIEDGGPKSFVQKTLKSNGFRGAEVRGTYQLGNMLGALTMAKERDEKYTTISGSDLVENPVIRLARMIKEVFWVNLTRRLDKGLIDKAAVDSKDWTENPRPRIYVPPGATDQIEYYRRLARERPELDLDVEVLPAEITLEVYRQMSRRPGVLALEMEEFIDPSTGEKDLRGLPFIVPGGRFNELYNWDSYFTCLGLLKSGMEDIAKSTVKHFAFEIRHYGVICNANRSYYILRSQPPFLTDLAWKVYTATKHQPDAKEFLRLATLAAIKEYTQVWMAEPRYHPKSGLSRYDTKNSGIPLECEDGAFEGILQPYMIKYGMGYQEFIEAFNNGSIKEEYLDEYFRHDRAVRESGHDISLRVEGVCADLATVDLNCLLYKYETDIARIIRTEFDNKLDVPLEFCPAGVVPHAETSSAWERKAELRKENMINHMWNEEKGMFVDYNTRLEKHHTVESATFLWPLWCGLASPEQATQIVANLPRFEMIGGLASTNLDSLPNKGNMPCHRKHQWDYPSGWAPHQILAWEGLRRYGYNAIAERLCYKWMHNIIKVFVDFNGAVVEKYDVTNERDPHKVDAEYGNQGVEFKGYAREGFGWTNASYLVGLSILGDHAKRALGFCAPWAAFEKSKKNIR